MYHLCFVTADAKEAVRLLSGGEAGVTEVSAPKPARLLRLLGLRKVMLEHTCRRRLDWVCEKVGLRRDSEERIVAMVSVAAASGDRERILAAFSRQIYRDKRLFMVLGSESGEALPDRDGVWCFRGMPEAEEAIRQLPPGALLGVLHPADHYGPQYLVDLALGWTYGGTTACGKSSQYVCNDGISAMLENDGDQYRRVKSLAVRSCLVERAAMPPSEMREWLLHPDVARFERDNCLALDEFNYLERGAGLPRNVLACVDTPEDFDTGMGIAEILGKFS